jgi:HD-GYP domain-containing protein (c-di-GMP phosphodiesterase class II)/DNA-binding CsgD family transcriptional regulator
MASPHQSDTRLRTAELLASLSLAIDLGVGQPMEWVLRSCLLAVRLGEALGMNLRDCQDAYYLSLLRHIGCTATATGDAILFGDELTIAEGMTMDMDDMAQVMSFVFRHVAKGQSFFGRAQAIVRMLSGGPEGATANHTAHCDVAMRIAQTLGFGARIQQGLWQVYERWDGKGTPKHLKGEELTLPVRVIQLAQDAATFFQLGGLEGAVTMVRARSGRYFDPAVVDVFCRHASDLLASLDTESTWKAVLASEPDAHLWMSNAQIDTATEVVADFVDLKSPFIVGHSRGVAALAAAAAQQYGLPSADVVAVRRAGLLHDLGRVGVSAALWNKPGPLSDSEWERVRLHPYYTERILTRSSVLAPLGALAALHHERLDGSGYHRQIGSNQLSPAARILAAADVYQALTEPRPHRPAASPGVAAGAIAQEVQAGRLDRDAVNAVLSAAGHRVRTIRREWPGGLSEREVEVLRLLARGLSNRQIAPILSISEKTVSHHIQHIYDKIDVSTRAAATLFAMRHDLLSNLDSDPHVSA